MHNRYLNGAPLPSSRKPFRSKERCLILVIFGAFILVFCGTFFYLPELRSTSGTRESVYKVYKHMQDAGPDLLIPAPPYAEELKEPIKPNQRHIHYRNNDDPHAVEDRYKLKIKIEEEQKNQKVLERPDIEVVVKNKASSPGVQNDGDQIHTVPPAKNLRPPTVVGGEDPDENIRRKRSKIVEVSAFTKLVRDCNPFTLRSDEQTISSQV